jgi:hypothetical protein
MCDCDGRDDWGTKGLQGRGKRRNHVYFNHLVKNSSIGEIGQLSGILTTLISLLEIANSHICGCHERQPLLCGGNHCPVAEYWNQPHSLSMCYQKMSSLQDKREQSLSVGTDSSLSTCYQKMSLLQDKERTECKCWHRVWFSLPFVPARSKTYSYMFQNLSTRSKVCAYTF